MRRLLSLLLLIGTGLGWPGVLRAQTLNGAGEVPSQCRIWDGTDVLLVGTSGELSCAQSGAWNVGQTGTWTVQQGTPPWSIALSQTTTNNDVDVLTMPTTTVTATDLDIRNLTAALDTVVCNAGTGTFTVGDGAGAFNVIVDSSALPTGAATSANQLAAGHTVTPIPGTSGGTSSFRRVSTADTNAANVKSSAGQVYQVIASNINAAARWIHLYNTAGAPTCNTGIIHSFIVPGNTTGAGTNITLDPGVAFATGIAICITTANDGTGAVAASDVVLNLLYK